MRHGRLGALLGAMLVALVAGPTTGRAQPPAEAVRIPDVCAEARPVEVGPVLDAERARDLFTVAVSEAADERWAEAEAGFRDSYESSGSPVAAFNLGLALRSLNRHLEARDALCIAAAAEALDPAIRVEAGELAVSEGQLTGTVAVIDVQPAEAALTIDGAAVTLGALPFDVRIDAGRTIRVEASAELYEPSSLELTLSPGERHELTLSLTAAPVTVRTDDTAVWIVVVAVVAAVAIGGGVLAWWAYEDAQLDPTYPMTTIRFP